MARVVLALLVSCAVAAATTGAYDTSAPRGFTLQLHRGAAPVRRRRTQVVPGEVVPLKPGLGTHFAWVYAGTPPQRASVITDTGSSLMAFPCSGCDGCGHHTDEPFQTRNSSTLAHVTCAAAPSIFHCRECGTEPTTATCSISQAYMEGSSWEATVVDDIVYLGGEDSGADETLRNAFSTHFTFGCQRKETGLFISQVADGIMGLANNGNNLVAKLHREQKIPANVFSLCFAYEGGSMSIGTPHTAQHEGDVAYAKLTKDTMRTDFYNVNLRDVRIANLSINASASSLTRGHFIVDSGTTDSYLPSSMRSAFESAFKLVTGLDYQTSGAGCKGFNDEQLAALPNIQVVLEAEDGSDLVLQIPPDQYLIQEKGRYCANVFLTEFSGGVIGANIMQDRDVIFDSDNHRVGFVDADCAYKESSTTNVSSSTLPRDHPVPGVVASSQTLSSAPSTAPAPATSVPAPATSAPAPALTTTTPTLAPTSTPTPTPTLESETVAPTSAPTPTAAAPTTSTPTPTTSAPTSTTSAPAPTPSETEVTITLDIEKPIATPTPSDSANTNAGHTDHEAVDEHPMVLTVVGTVLVAVFLLVVAASIKMNRRKKDHNWSRVKENEEEEEDGDDADDDEELGTRKTSNSSKQQVRSDDVGSDDDDDEDEIFDRSSHDHEDTKHDTRMLERL